MASPAQFREEFGIRYSWMDVLSCPECRSSQLRMEEEATSNGQQRRVVAHPGDGVRRLSVTWQLRWY